jgi:hypothetical protein
VEEKRRINDVVIVACEVLVGMIWRCSLSCVVEIHTTAPVYQYCSFQEAL